MQKLKAYIALTKPGIVRGNLVAAIAGFCFAANGSFDWIIFAGLIIGTWFIVASGCIFNNVLDRDIDRKMQRTKNRGLATGEVPIDHALSLATALGVVGPLILLYAVNIITFLLGLAGLAGYVVLYTLSKRVTPYSTLLGTLPGAVPPAAGYTAVTGRFDETALILFIIMALWQLPHFYAIAVYRQKDYAAAGLPVWSVVHGIPATKLQIKLSIGLYMLALPLLYVASHASTVYLIVLLPLALWWLLTALKPAKDDTRWGKKVFGVSLLLMMAWSLLLTINWVLP